MQNHLRTARIIAKLLDSQFTIGGFRFGLDPLIGLIPGIGDAISFVLSLYLIWIGYSLGIKPGDLRRMIGNVVIDAIFGSVPFIGDAVDFVYKANSKNMQILEKYADSIIEGEIVDS